MSHGIAEISSLVGGLNLDMPSALSVKDFQAEDSISFASRLQGLVSEVDHDIKQADEALVRVATGQSEFLHREIAALEKANMSLRLGIEVRNRLVEAYQQLSQMQI